MDKIELFQIDTFTDKVFHGNPAAVCLLPLWLNDELLQAIATETNLSETAFVIEDDKGFHIRWFTPIGEISLCGHATLVAGFVLLELGKCPQDSVQFDSLSGLLTVNKQGDFYTLSFPRLEYQPYTGAESIRAVVDKPCVELFESELDYLMLMASELEVARAKVDINFLSLLPKRGLIITAPASDVDFYSRCFYPKHNIGEDPVTGSAHCVLAPFWSERLNKTRLQAIQGAVRKGEITCEVFADRVDISGQCKWFLQGELVI